ncbi:MAG: dihydrodipicolinate synthase family protein [Bacteroidota bacterium]
MTKNSLTHPFERPQGVFAATLTPMDEDYNVDIALLAAHCKWLLAHGTNGIVLSGTTGEANSLSVDEKMKVLDGLLAQGIPASKLIVGTGCCAFPDTVALTRHAVAQGVAGVLMLPPFYYKGVSDAGLFASFSEVITRVGADDLRIYLYHFPKMSMVPFSLDLISQLLMAYPAQIAGIKDSSGDWGNMSAMVREFPGFDVFAGSEAFLLDILQEGGVGCISASVNITSPLAGDVYQHWQDASANGLQAKLTAVRHAFQAYPFIPTLKGIMHQRSGHASWQAMRPPHLPASQSEIDAALASMATLDFTLEPINYAV